MKQVVQELIAYELEQNADFEKIEPVESIAAAAAFATIYAAAIISSNYVDDQVTFIMKAIQKRFPSITSESIVNLRSNDQYLPVLVEEIEHQSLDNNLKPELALLNEMNELKDDKGNQDRDENENDQDGDGDPNQADWDGSNGMNGRNIGNNGNNGSNGNHYGGFGGIGDSERMNDNQDEKLCQLRDEALSLLEEVDTCMQMGQNLDKQKNNGKSDIDQGKRLMQVCGK